MVDYFHHIPFIVHGELYSVCGNLRALCKVRDFDPYDITGVSFDDAEEDDYENIRNSRLGSNGFLVL